MKHSLKATKSKPGKQTDKPDSIKKGGLFLLPRWVLLALCLVIPAAGAWAAFEFLVWNKLPPELVGKWVVLEGPQEGATLDFSRRGTLIGKVNLAGKEGILNARVQVDGKKLLSTTKHPRTGQDETHVQVIRTLTAKEMVLEDERGGLLKLERTD
jgi:hypothetical protein